MKNMKEIIAAVEKALEKYHIYAYVHQHDDLPVVAVEIEWGDWKHDHRLADIIVEEDLGGQNISTKITAEDGSDCYSAVHYYMFA